MSEYLFETIDDLFKVIHRQGQKLETLENRVASLERQLEARRSSQPPFTSVEAVKSERDIVVANCSCSPAEKGTLDNGIQAQSKQ